MKLEADQLAQVTASAGYAAILRRIEEMRTRKLAEIVGPLDQMETERARGYLAGLAACVAVPEQLRREMEPDAPRRRIAR